ncbi:Nitroreductase [Aspergillus steynii IBT 23096]|uniref:Nitroreductase n=1 Tax=Aspergillus steynii IBT 23096 TaxID=1392250 RepID=A0A2I2GPL3_9EURO|nr:Nitroreductase [Aspergillus steynii IBT 23096]PLB54822.1 Nitroreductase [Aspergillus steynii IBT 23096]
MASRILSRGSSSRLPLLSRFPSISKPSLSASPRLFSTTPNNSNALISLAQSRRTIYNLGKTLPPSVTDKEIESLVHAAILNVPSAFNTQSTRLVLLLHSEHERLWDVVMRSFEEGLVSSGKVSREIWEGQTRPKLEGMRGGVGTVLFYEDPAHIEPFKEKFATYKDHFETWAQHSNAMHQYFLWTGLESLGFGANLQHYNPLVDAPVAAEWDIPRDWKLVAQLVFGSPEGGPNEKSQKPIEERVKVFGKRD